jgi:DNA-binding LacI/PurR family transcriptional regulator
MKKDRQAARAKITDIAREAGVSISTVSRVLNQTVPVAPETSERVWLAVTRLAYTPNSAARRLASNQANTIGLVLPEISGIFFPPMLRGIERCVNHHGYDLLIYSAGRIDHAGSPYRRPLGEHNTDGLLVFTGSLGDPELSWFHHRGFPVVLLHRSAPPGLEIPVVRFENQASAAALVDHLIEAHGCRRIAFLRGPEGNEDSREREMGYQDALARHGLESDPNLVETGGFDTQGGLRAAALLVDRGARFDAIFCGDDEAAAGALFTLNQREIRVPEEVRVVGFDDNFLAPLLPVPLTTVHASSEQAGYQAASQLIRLIQTGQADALTTVLPTQLVIRRSCGCNAGYVPGVPSSSQGGRK